MSIRITCDGCHAVLVAGESLINKEVRCPRCRRVIVVTPPLSNVDEELAAIDFGSSDLPSFGDWADLNSGVETWSPTQAVPNIQRPSPPELEKAPARADSLTVIKTLVVALPLATIFLLVFALNAGSLPALGLLAGVAFLVWLGGIGAAIYCNQLGEQGFSSIGKVLSTAGVLLIPVPLSFVIHITATSRNRGMVYKSLQKMGTDMRYSMESNASELPEAPIPNLRYLEGTGKLATTTVGPLEAVALGNIGSLRKVVWSEDASQAHIMTSNGFEVSRLWRYERAKGITCGVEILGKCTFGRSQQDLIIVRSDTAEIYFLDPDSLKVRTARSVRKSFGLIAHPASQIVLVNTNDNLLRIIDANARRQVGFLDASFFPDEHWLSNNGRPYTLANMTARMQFADDGQTLMCMGGVFRIEGTTLTWSEPAREAFWQVRKGHTYMLADGALRLEHLDWDGSGVSLRYRSPISDDANSSEESSARYQDLVVPSDSAPIVYRLTSMSPDKSALAVNANRTPYLFFAR